MPYSTYTDDPELLRRVNDYKAALAAARPVQDRVWELNPGSVEWYEARQKSDIASEALRVAELNLAAAFVWALEHQQEGK